MEASAQPLANGNWLLVIRQQLTNGQKWLAAIILGVLFAIFASPPLWGLAHSLTGKVSNGSSVYQVESKANNAYLSLFVLTIIFILVVRLIMW